MRGSNQYKILLPKNLTSLFSFINLGFIQGSNALIQLLLVYVIARVLGLDELGRISVGTTYAMLIGTVVNYGSNQSGVKDVALYEQDPTKLAELFYLVYATRIIIFIISIALLIAVIMLFPVTFGKYFLLASLLIFSEMLNPFFFFVGVQKLFLYNALNFTGRLLSVISIIALIHNVNQGPWVNFYMGAGNTITYGFLIYYIIRRYNLTPKLEWSALKRFFITNIYLTGNNLAVQLQQSYFVLAISTTGNAVALGAYALCDKMLMGFRMLIIAFSNAVFPRATLSFRDDPTKWLFYKRRINFLLFGVFSVTAFLIFLFAPEITHILLKEKNLLAIKYIRCISIVPLVAALNSMNVIDLLMKDQYRHIFTIAMLLLVATISSATIFISVGDAWSYGYYPLTVELFSLPLYWYFIKRVDRSLY